MADNRKLAAGLAMFTPSAREDIARRADDLERGKTVELLRRAGKEMYDNPVVNAAISFTPGAGDLQSGYEAFNSARQGNWGEAGLNALGVLPFIPSMGFLGKTVWHGSPHTFDAFDLSKIGTGEGAQAYGHGLYLAEAPEVAKGYRAGKEGSEMNVFVGGKQFEPQTNAEKTAANLLGYETRTIGADPFARAEKYFVENIPDVNSETAKRYEDALQTVRNLREQGATLEGGSLYKVDLPDEHIAKMLDWDKPLSEQAPEVLDAIKQSSAKYGATRNYAPIYSEEAAPYMRGQDFYRDLANSLSDGGVRRGSTALSGQDALASQHLNELGIPGIQYLDQASRGAGEGTRNYVVFSDEIPQILERNGQPVGMFGGGK